MTQRGEIHLARFPYSDLRGSKRRPICILSTEDYNAAGPDVLTAMITSNRRRWENPGFGDVRLRNWESEGLLHPSVLRRARCVTSRGFSWRVQSAG
jgi:PemK-like, MazF-like toxin of type II toxin-antitoxin system